MPLTVTLIIIISFSSQSRGLGSGHGGCVFLATELKFWLKLLSASIGCCKLPSGVWGAAPAEIEFGAF